MNLLKVATKKGRLGIRGDTVTIKKVVRKFGENFFRSGRGGSFRLVLALVLTLRNYTDESIREIYKISQINL